MKKINILLTSLLLLGAGFASCDNEQVLPPVAFPDGGSQESMGTGAWDNPFRVWQVLLGSDNGTDANGNPRSSAWITGYIVGYIMDGPTFNGSTSVFSADGAGTANILLAETPEETDWEKCVPVQLSNIRNEVNLSSNPGNLGKEICIKGSLERYFGANGIKSCSAFVWGSEGEYSPDDDAPQAPDISGGTTYLLDGMNDFTQDNISLDAALNYVWSWDSSYNCAKASAYVGGGNKPSESYLVSPEIKLSDSPAATFSQALNYLYNNSRADYVSVCVREGKTGAWTEVNVSTWPDGSGWTFSDNCSIDLSAFAGKTVQIGFHYKSTSSCAPTWEVKRLVVK